MNKILLVVFLGAASLGCISAQYGSYAGAGAGGLAGAYGGLGPYGLMDLNEMYDIDYYPGMPLGGLGLGLGLGATRGTGAYGTRRYSSVGSPAYSPSVYSRSHTPSIGTGSMMGHGSFRHRPARPSMPRHGGGMFGGGSPMHGSPHMFGMHGAGRRHPGMGGGRMMYRTMGHY